MSIPFFKPDYGAEEQKRVTEALSSLGDPAAEAKSMLAKTYGEAIFLTASATAAFELLFATLGLERGGEVVMPSFTYPSCANAILRAGLKPVFAEIDARTKTLDLNKLSAVLNANTRAVVPMHYGAASVDMDALKARVGGALLIEDAALSFGARYRGTPLGAVGDMGVLSFHRTKNISADEGGLLVFSEKHRELAKKARTLYDNGTDRAAFLRGEVSAYTWRAAGVNVAMGRLNAALLCAQLGRSADILHRHRQIYLRYLENLSGAAKNRGFELPVIPDDNENNFELFYILLESETARDKVQAHLKEKGIGSAFHYMALHASAMGHSLGYAPGDLPVTESVCGRLLRLPLFAGMTIEQCDLVSQAVKEALCRI
ncbi:MAG: aminotransferase class I/II-fold pyridoxal phosphate-dependent enzyme [Clostridiaceae bacterium]